VVIPIKQKLKAFSGGGNVLNRLTQYAGGHLKELQKAFKRPTANLGLVLEEGSKRARR